MRSRTVESLDVTPPPGRPHPALAGLVDGYVGYRQELPHPGIHRGLPSSVVTLVFAFEEPIDVGWLRDPASQSSYWALVSGLHTEPAEIHHPGLQCGIQLGLTAEGSRRLLGMPMGEVATQIVSFDAVAAVAAESWHDRLCAQPSWRHRYRVLDQLLLEMLRRHDGTVAERPEVSWSWNQIQTTAGSARIHQIAAQLGWSRRHLTQCFTAEFGLPPKQLARVARFERSRSGLSSRQPLAAVAADCGFADQAHLSREWRSMAGYSPREWQSLELPFLQDFVAPAGQGG